MTPHVALLLLLLSWVQPFHVMPWMSWHSEVLAFAAVGLLAGRGLWRVWRGKGQRSDIPMPLLAWVMVGILGLIGLQTLVGQIVFAGDALVLGLYVGLAIASLGLGVAAGRAASDPDGQGPIRQPLLWLAATVLAAAFLSGIAALVQACEVWDGTEWVNRMGSWRRPGANLGQPNQLATLLLMGLVSLHYLWEQRKLGRSSALLILLVLTVALTLTESRAAQLSLLGLLVWWFVARRRVGFRMSAGVVLLVAVLIMGSFWLWPPFLAAGEAGAASGVQSRLSGGGRLIVWPQLWEAVLLRPWTGWGLHEVSAAHNAVVHAYAVSEPYGYAHNLLLDMALGMGLPLTIILALAAGYGLWRRIVATESLHAWYCLAAVLPVLIHSMLEFPYAYAYFLAPVMFLLGWLDAEFAQADGSRIDRKWASVAYLAVVALGLTTVREYLAIEEDFLVARFEVLNVGQTPQTYVRPKVHLLTQMGALLEGARLMPKPAMTSSELELARNMALRFPWPATQHRYALALALNGQPEEARRQLQVIRAQYRHNERIYDGVKTRWLELAASKYPQLKDVELP